MTVLEKGNPVDSYILFDGCFCNPICDCILQAWCGKQGSGVSNNK